MTQPTSASILTIAAAGCTLTLLVACTGSNSQSEPDKPPPQVVVVRLKTQPITLTRELPGRIRASLVAEVRPQVSGIVKRLLFTEGGYVKAGQALYELDDAIYRAQHESAQATLHKAQATLHAAQLAAARSRELNRIDAVSAQDNEGAIAAEAQAQADVSVAQALVQSAQVTLAYTRVVAPISGRIGKSAVTQGALVTAQQPAALATIQQLDPAYVEMNQSSSSWLALKQAVDAGKVRSHASGSAARILLENGSAYAHEGKLQFSDVTVDPANGNILLRAVVPNPQLLLLPGMYVRAAVDEGALTQGLLAPQQGIARDPKGNASALVVGKDGKVELRTVHVSRAVADQWLVEDGLSPGDRLIVEGLQRADPGTVVQAVERTAANATIASR
jgi:membrane fusion protein, multidrug efflux system